MLSGLFFRTGLSEDAAAPDEEDWSPDAEEDGDADVEEDAAVAAAPYPVNGFWMYISATACAPAVLSFKCWAS